LKPSTLTNLRGQDLLAHQTEAWPGRFADLRVLSRMTPDTVVRRRPEIPVAVNDEGRFLHIAFADRKVTIPVFMREQLPRILGHGDFAIGEIEGMITSAGKIKLIVELVRSGILQIVRI